MSLGVQLAHIRPTVSFKFKVYPGQGQSMEEFIEQNRNLDNPILEVNREEEWIMVSQRTIEDDRWGCLLCLQASVLSFCDTEEELRSHLDQEHSGWEADANGKPIL